MKSAKNLFSTIFRLKLPLSTLRWSGTSRVLQSLLYHWGLGEAATEIESEVQVLQGRFFWKTQSRASRRGAFGSRYRLVNGEEEGTRRD